MEIKPFMILTIEEFKASNIFDTSMEEATTYADNYLSEAIYIASNIADYFSGYKLSKIFINEFLEKPEEENQLKVWNEYQEQIKGYQNIKYGVIRHINHLLRKGIEYMRGQSSFSLGSQSYSTSNPEDPLYVVPELLIELQKANLLQKQYIGNYSDTKKGFNYLEDLKQGATKFITWAEANAFFVKYERFKSSDNSILKISPDNPYNPILDLIVDKLPLIESISNNIELLNKIINKLINDNNFFNQIKESLKNDEQFLQIIKNEVNNLKPEILEETKTNLVSDNDFLDKVASAMPPIDQNSFNALLTNSQLYKDLQNEIKILNDLQVPIGTIISVEIGTIMNSTYWQKLDLEQGYTLINGIEKGNSIGQVLTHNHNFNNSTSSSTEVKPIGFTNPISEVNTYIIYGNAFSRDIGGENKGIGVITSSSGFPDYSISNQTKPNNNFASSNLSAGKNVEFYIRIA